MCLASVQYSTKSKDFSKTNRNHNGQLSQPLALLVKISNGDSCHLQENIFLSAFSKADP